LELSKDIPAFDSRISVLEKATGTIFTNNNFTVNTILGSMLQDASIPASKLIGQITGDQLVTNSIHGITNENIASSAAIAISKIDISTLNHSQLQGVATLTHAQIENQLTSLSVSITEDENSIAITNAAIGSVNTFLGNRVLSTTANDVTDAINELKTEVSNFSVIIPSGANFTGNQDQYHVLRATGANHTIEESQVQALDTGILLPSQSFVPSTPTSGIEIYGRNNQVYAIDTSGDIYNLCQGSGSSFSYLTQTSLVCSGINSWCEMTNNSITLPPGTWELNGHVVFDTTDGTAQIGAIGYKWSSNNGDNGSTVPSDITNAAVLVGKLNPIDNITTHMVMTNYAGIVNHNPGNQIIAFLTPTSPVVITTTASTPVYLDPWCSLYDPTHVIAQVMIYAKRLA
jgi:hypothetical protein